MSSVIVSGSGQAVKDTGRFEMDGNAVTTVSDDWDEVCHQVLNADCSTLNNTDGATAVSWTSDNLLNGTPSTNASIFTGGGSKDPSDINQWAWKDGSGGLPDKANLLHSFAARYSLAPSATCPSGGAATCEVLFFGNDRFDNSGDAVQAFWFFQNEITLGNQPLGGGQNFNGVHRAGDLLVISEFSNGGTVSTIVIYKWNPAVAGNLELLASSNAANCNQVASGAPFCGIVNPNNGDTAPWPFTDKSGNSTYLQGEFFEGGVNLSLLGLSNLCFASVASETRTSTSTTSVLKDFVLGSFAPCGSSLTTTPQPASSVSIGTGSVSVQDSANLTVTGTTTWSGTLAFSLCGPIAAPDTCTAGGTAIGSAVPVSNTTVMPVLSDSAAVTSVGRYCWRGFFDSATDGVPDATDARDSECFTVTPVTPTLTTNATPSVEIGNPIADTATLAGTANKPGSPVINPTTAGGPAGGSITFRAYGPNDPTCSGTPAFTSSAIPVSGDNNYGSGNFTPTAAGTYLWVATYTGDSPNTTGPVSNSCGEASETTVVTPRTPSVTTQAVAGPVSLGSPISDTASLTGTANQPDGSPAGGTITFKAYGPNDATCANTPAFTATVNVSGDGQYNSGNFIPSAAGIYRWTADYSGDPPNTNAASSPCNAENESSEVIQLNPAITTEQTFTVEDSATITVQSGAGDLTGSIRFRLYPTADCSGTALFDSGQITVNGPSPQTKDSGTYTFVTPQPTLAWLVEYTSTNTGHTNVTSACNTENASLTYTNG